MLTVHKEIILDPEEILDKLAPKPHNVDLLL